ncbi:MAG: ferric siderophore ABC transporter substrate-binding protein [Flavobacteriaceae bacterium]|jgi:hypothetical protein|nr:ferric siderophore ABC transporter substrate-binding protein [Flavobacteriaceae bacterium]
MNTSYIIQNKKEETKDRVKSGFITAVVWSLLLLFVFLYTVTESFPEKQEAVTTMLVNFGDNGNGNGLEEPAEQLGSLAAETNENISETELQDSNLETEISSPEISKPETRTSNLITGNSEKTSVKKTETTDKTGTDKKTGTKNATSSSTTSNKTSTENANSKTGTGDGKGTAAVGNLLKGRGTKPGTQGTGGTSGNAGDPLGGTGNGDSKIGVDRKLIAFIPGTMGRGGKQPPHNCKASGTVTISYIVDKAGNVTSAWRSGGISDECVVLASVIWVKKYVKAEKANTSSTGTYKITF